MALTLALGIDLHRNGSYSCPRKSSGNSSGLVSEVNRGTLYSCYGQVASGYVFGMDQPLILHLLDIPVAMGSLGGVVMEIQVHCRGPYILYRLSRTAPCRWSGTWWPLTTPTWPSRCWGCLLYRVCWLYRSCLLYRVCWLYRSCLLYNGYLLYTGCTRGRCISIAAVFRTSQVVVSRTWTRPSWWAPCPGRRGWRGKRESGAWESP